MIEFLHNLLLLPYNLFAYIFSVVIWWILVVYIIHYVNDNNGGDFFQYKFNRFINLTSWMERIAVFAGLVESRPADHDAKQDRECFHRK